MGYLPHGAGAHPHKVIGVLNMLFGVSVSNYKEETWQILNIYMEIQ